MKIDIANVVANSFRDLHVKGFDYLCLKRSPELTVKLYVYDGDVSKMPEIVNPHDHRYDFMTTCLVGGVVNHEFERHSEGMTYNAFDYDTPLNGGGGFSWREEIKLRRRRSSAYGRGGDYWFPHDAIHTIQLTDSQTVLMLQQFSDVVPIGVPTTMFSLGNEPPTLDGLYRKFTEDAARKLLRDISGRTSLTFEESSAWSAAL